MVKQRKGYYVCGVTEGSEPSGGGGRSVTGAWCEWRGINNLPDDFACHDDETVKGEVTRLKELNRQAQKKLNNILERIELPPPVESDFNAVLEMLRRGE